MGATRRQILKAGGLATLATTLGAGLAGCGDNGGGGGDGGGELIFTWWGNDVRNEITTQVIDAYEAANDGVTITPQPGEWSSYWQRLATEMTANAAPDIIQMDEKYIREYGDRGALLDLGANGVDTSKFAPGTAEPGIIQDKLIGVNAGSNTPVLIANPKIFNDLGVDLPDDMSWTWDDFKAVSIEITGKGDGIFGSASVFNNDSILSAWLRQHDKNLFDDDGLAFDAADATEYFTMAKAFGDENAMPSAAAISEDIGKALAQTTFATGGAALGMCWSNQVKAFDEATGEDLTILRLPSVAGDALQRKAWYKASMFFSASADTSDPEAVGAFINWLVNSEEAGNILLTERGLTPNTEVLAAIEPKLEPSDLKVAEFMAAIEPELSDAPPPPVVGGGTIQDVLARNLTPVLFEEMTPQAAGEQFVTQMSEDIANAT